MVGIVCRDVGDCDEGTVVRDFSVFQIGGDSGSVARVSHDHCQPSPVLIKWLFLQIPCQITASGLQLKFRSRQPLLVGRWPMKPELDGLDAGRRKMGDAVEGGITTYA